MEKSTKKNSRRNFFKESMAVTAGIGLGMNPMLSAGVEGPTFAEDNLYLIGPQKGYSMHIGTLLSTMTMMRAWVVNSVKDLTQQQLDWQLDDESNSIGAMLYHLAATEKYYQLNTFDEVEWGEWDEEIKNEWDVPMDLGQQGREQIIGNDIGFYLSKLEAVRKVTKKEFAKRDDEWIMKSAPFFGNQPTNNYCKWFHVCEHESNHNGQIKFIKSRIPS